MINKYSPKRPDIQDPFKMIVMPYTALYCTMWNRLQYITYICLDMCPGSDIQARDYGRRMTPREWALFTGRYVTAGLMSQLMAKPCAEQFCDSFSLEWPMLEVNASSLCRCIWCMTVLFKHSFNPTGTGGPGPKAKVPLEAFDQPLLLLPL